MTNVKVAQVAYNVNLTQKYIAAWQAYVRDTQNASKAVTGIFADVEVAGVFKKIDDANTLLATANDASTALTIAYTQACISNKYSDEEAARALIATDAPKQIKALNDVMTAFQTSLNPATNVTGDPELFHNLTPHDQDLFVAAFTAFSDAADDAYLVFKMITDSIPKHTDTALATVATTTIPAAATALGNVSSKMWRVAADLQNAINTTGAVLTPAQTSIKKAIDSLKLITAASSGLIPLFDAANTAVFTALDTTVS